MRRFPLVACLPLALLGCKTPAAAGPGATEPATAAPAAKAGADVSFDQLPLELSLDGSAPATPSGEDRKAMLVLGMTRPLGTEAAQAAARNLEAYLTTALGGDVAVRVFAGVAPLAEALAKGEVQLAWLTPTAFVAAADRTELKPVAKLVRNGYAFYRSALFVRADSGLSKLEDLRGRTVIWARPGSASGRLFPLAHLRKHGIDTGTFFADQLTAADHKEICAAVLEGRADAGATISDERLADQEPLADGCRGAGLDPAKFKVILRTIPIPNDVVVARADLAPDLAAKVHEAFAALGKGDSGKAFLKEIFSADAFAEASEADYRSVRDVQLMMGERD